MDNDILHRLIDKYFEGETTLEEERMLRRMLMNADQKNRRVQEAIAVMGYARLAPLNGIDIKKTGFRRSRFRIAGIVAACGVVAICITMLFAGYSRSGQDVCLAYVGGERVENREAVVELMELQLGEFSEVATEIDKEVMVDFSEMGTALDSNIGGTDSGTL